MKHFSLLIPAIVTCVVGIGVAWAAGDWSSARNRVDDFKNRQADLKRMTPDETKKIVTAICEADEEARRDVGRAISDRISSTMQSKVSDIERVRDDANKLLDDVLSDDNLKSTHSDAKSLKDEVKTRWESVDKMTRSLRGSNHPVVSYMVDQGNRAHVDRQSSCDAKEVTLDSGRLDCAMASGETCYVIEFKPDNSRAVDKGEDQAKRYASELNDELKKAESSIIKKLRDTDSDFAKCKRFVPQVDCYKLCPDVNEDGEFRDVNVSWKKDCS